MRDNFQVFDFFGLHRKFASGLNEESRICDDPIPTFGTDLILSNVDQIGTAFNGDCRTALTHLAVVQLGIQGVVVKTVVVGGVITRGVTATKNRLVYLVHRDGARNGKTVRTKSKIKF